MHFSEDASIEKNVYLNKAVNKSMKEQQMLSYTALNLSSIDFGSVISLNPAGSLKHFLIWKIKSMWNPNVRRYVALCPK